MMVNERSYPNGLYPSLDWWDKQPDSQWLSERERCLIRIGYFECLGDQRKKDEMEIVGYNYLSPSQSAPSSSEENNGA